MPRYKRKVQGTASEDAVVGLPEVVANENSAWASGVSEMLRERSNEVFPLPIL